MQTNGWLLTVEEASQLLRVKRSTLYSWVHRRQVPFQKVRGLLRFRQNDLQKWLDDQRRTVDEERQLR